MLANRMRENQLAHMPLDEELCGTGILGKGKANGNGKDKQFYIPKPKNPKPYAKEHPAKDNTCHHCKEVGHCKRNCHAYLAKLIKKKKKVGTASSSDVFIIELFSFPTKSWVYDTSSDFGILVSKNNVVYFNAIPSNGIYEIDMIFCYQLIIYLNVSTKRVKHYLDSTYLWHCHLAHINKKRIEKLQQEGLLKSTDDESFDQCVSCLSGKMTRKSFPHHPERVTDLLGIIHTDVCGPVWGCEALVKRDTPDKLEQRSFKCIFIGYPKENKGLLFYSTEKIVVARYAEFFKKRLISQEISRRAVDLEEIQEEEDTTPSEITSNIPQEVEGFEPPQPPQEKVIPIRRSERTRRAPNRLCLNVEVEEYSLGDLNEPTSYKAAMLDLESNKWIDAMNAEIQSMMDNMVWVLVDLPPGCKTVGSKWLFKKKTNMDGIVHTYKVCLVAKGYTKLYGVDYEETFSPVADIRAIRILISIAAKVCKLQRSIYGLKQASRSWNKRFDEEIKRFGFAQNLDEPCGNHIPSLQSVKNYLGKCFSMKDLGEAAFILGIKIYRDRSKRLIGLSQNAYMDKILKRYKMDNSKRGHIPMQERPDLNKSQGAQMPKEVNRIKNVPYASAVGCIMYAVRCTGPDVAFANTKDMFLVYGENPEAELRVDCYCNAGFKIDINDMKSLTG
ncbi:retrotransposon protein, putative, ty1-copia subclass [Tanacetum coccineum]